MSLERRPTRELEEEFTKLSAFEAITIRGFNVVIAIVGRLVDVVVAALRPRLLWPYLRLWGAELLRSPYGWPRHFEAVRAVKASGQTLRELMYGEVLLASGVWLFRRAGVGRGARLLDVGAGRGRALLAARWLGAEATGLELRDDHVRIGAPAVESSGARLRCGDALTEDLGTPTHVFLNWCAFSPETKARLVERLAQLAPGTRIVAVTQRIDDPRFATQSQHRTLFTWGTERCWVQMRV